MKILFIGPASDENKYLVKSAIDRGHRAQIIGLSQISFVVKNNKMEVMAGGKKLPQFDVCLFRGISPSFAKAKALAKYLHSLGTRVVDKELYSEVYEFDKVFMTESLVEGKVPVIDSYYFSTFAELKNFASKLPSKLLIKDVHGMHSRNIFCFNGQAELIKFFEKRKADVGNFLIQKRLNAEYYYRVFVVGRKVLGAMKRMTIVNEKRLTVRLNERSTVGRMNAELSEISLLAMKATHADIAGIDVIYDGKMAKVLEVNRSPKFARFTEVMGVEVASEIIKYLEK